MKQNFSVVIASKGEAKNLPIILPKVLEYCDDVIVVIDRMDYDNSSLICKRFPVTILRQIKSGKGDALRLGVSSSARSIIVFMDADGSHNPREIPKIVRPIDEYGIDLVVGSRMLGGSAELFSEFSHIVRLVGSLFITMALNRKFRVNITDSQNGFRAIKRMVFEELHLKEMHTTIEQEMTSKLLAANRYQMIEIGTHEFARNRGVSKIKVFIHGWRYLFVLAQILFWRKGKAFKTSPHDSHPLFLQAIFNSTWYSI